MQYKYYQIAGQLAQAYYATSSVHSIQHITREQLFAMLPAEEDSVMLDPVLDTHVHEIASLLQAHGLLFFKCKTYFAIVPLKAVENSANLLDAHIEHEQIKKLIEAAVKTNANLIRSVPDRLLTEDIQCAAVRGNYEVLVYLDKPSDTVIIEAINAHGHDALIMLKHPIPQKLFITYVKSVHGSLAHIDSQYRTREVCMAAVQKRVHNLEYVPRYVLDAEICLAAANTSSSALAFVPDAFLTYQLCAYVIGKDPLAVTYLRAPNRCCISCIDYAKLLALALDGSISCDTEVAADVFDTVSSICKHFKDVATQTLELIQDPAKKQELAKLL